MRCYRPAYTRPLKADEKVRRSHVTVVDGDGQPKRCKVIESPKGRRVVVESSTWTIVFRDHTGTERRLIAFRERADSDVLGKHIGQLVYHLERGDGLPAGLQEWTDALPAKVHEQLAGFGLLRRRRPTVSRDVENILEHFEQHLLVKRQRSERYVKEVTSKLRRIFKACGFHTFHDVDDVVLDKYLLRLRQKENKSTRTLNGHLGACQQFCRFAIRVLKVAKASPLECMEGFGSVKADVRRQRRALSQAEIQKLLTTTAQSPQTRFGMDGLERSMLYQFTLTTGLRANEIRNLRVEHIDFDDEDGPVLYVDAAYSKHRERDVLPLHHSLVQSLKRFIVERSKTPQAKLFGGDYAVLTDKTADMIRMDLADAGVEYQTVAGTADFHCLRHTYVSSLKGIPSRLAQGLARHKSSDMTDRYSHRSLAEQRAVLEQVQFFGLAG